MSEATNSPSNLTLKTETEQRVCDERADTGACGHQALEREIARLLNIVREAHSGSGYGPCECDDCAPRSALKASAGLSQEVQDIAADALRTDDDPFKPSALKSEAKVVSFKQELNIYRGAGETNLIVSAESITGKRNCPKGE